MTNPLLLARGDFNSLGLIVPAAAPTSIVAGKAGNDATPIVGVTINRASPQCYGAEGPLDLNSMPTGATFVVNYSATLGAGNTITIGNGLVEDSANGSTWATVYDQTGKAAVNPPTWPTAGVVDTGATGGSTQLGCITFPTDIQRCRQYVRFTATPDMSAASTDVATISVSAVLTGFSELPPR